MVISQNKIELIFIINLDTKSTDDFIEVEGKGICSNEHTEKLSLKSNGWIGCMVAYVEKGIFVFYHGWNCGVFPTHENMSF